MNQWSINTLYNVGDIIQIKTDCGMIKHYITVIKHISSPVPSGFKSDLEKYWKETDIRPTQDISAQDGPSKKECIDQEDMVERTLTITIGVFIGLIISKIVS